eukprot:6195225-Pleurochrysis_carterae.AAC.1
MKRLLEILTLLRALARAASACTVGADVAWAHQALRCGDVERRPAGRVGEKRAELYAVALGAKVGPLPLFT